MSLAVNYDFSDSVVLVTGGASGMGAATAHACARLGAQVVALDVDAAGIERIGATPGIDARLVDVSDSAAVTACIDDILGRYGKIDGAVLGAAIQQRTPIAELGDAEWRRHLAVNLDGVFHCIRAIGPAMCKARSGSILTFTSGLVNMGWNGAAAYAASKGALVGLTKCAAVEFKPFGVRANLISPGLVTTPVWLNVAGEGEREMYADSIGISEPEAVVPTILHLISDASREMTGAIIERRLVPAH